MSTATSWEWVGRVGVLICAWLIVSAILAVAELYWPAVYRFIANATIAAVLGWLFLWRQP